MSSSVKQSLPSFVDLLSSLGLNDSEPRPKHLRNDSSGSTQSSASSRISPLHSPHVRLSGGRQFSSIAGSSSRRYAPYGPPRDLNDRRGSLPTLSIMPPPPLPRSSTSIAAQRRRSGSLPTLLESPYASNDGQEYDIPEESPSAMSSNATSPASFMGVSSPNAYTFPPPPTSNPTNYVSQQSLSYIGPSDTSDPIRGAAGAATMLPALSPLSPQKRHLTPRTRLSIAVSSPSPPPSEQALRSPIVSVSSPFRSTHHHHEQQHSSNSQSNASIPPNASGVTQPRRSLASPAISSFVRKSSSHASLNGPAVVSPIRTHHHHHPYAYPPSPTSIVPPPTGLPPVPDDDDADGGGGGGDVAVGQRYKRRGSLTLSLAPLSLSVSRHNRPAPSSQNHHRRTGSGSSNLSAPRTPLSPMAIPTLPDAVGLVQRNMTMGLPAMNSNTSSPISMNSTSRNPAVAMMAVPSLPSLPPMAGPSVARPRQSAGKMRSMGHMRVGSREEPRRVQRKVSGGVGPDERRIPNSSSSSSISSNSAASTAHQSSPYSSNSSAPVRRPPFLTRKNTSSSSSTPTITVKTEEEDEIDELADDPLGSISSAATASDREGYGSTRSASSASAYDAQDEMQLDDEDGRSSRRPFGPTPTASSSSSSSNYYYDNVPGLGVMGGVAISQRRRASLHPLDGATSHRHHPYHHARSFSDNGPAMNGNVRKVAGSNEASAPPSSFSSFNVSTVAPAAGTRIARRSTSTSSNSSSGSVRGFPSLPTGKRTLVGVAVAFSDDEDDDPEGNTARWDSKRLIRGNGAASRSSSSGNRTPTGVDSRGNSAASSPMHRARRSPPNVVVSSAA